MHNSIRTITWKFKDVSESYPQLRNKNIKITSPQDLYDHFLFLFEREVQERFVVFWLSSCNKVIGFETITIGLLNSSQCHSREVFRGAIVASCANIILSHNHPSGNLEPSREDIKITQKLVEAGKITEVNVFDHIIFTDDGFTSFVERGLL